MPTSTTSTPATTPQLTSTVKTLFVDFSGYQPRFVFEGYWTGRDMRVLLTHARRAYFLHIKSIRTISSLDSSDAPDLPGETLVSHSPATTPQREDDVVDLVPGLLSSQKRVVRRGPVPRRTRTASAKKE